MGFWLEILKSVADSVGADSSSDAKVQIRQPSDGIWRDFSYVSGNVDSLQSGIDLASSAFPDASVRVVDADGRVVDFR